MKMNRDCPHTWLKTATIGGIKFYWHCIFCKYKTDLRPIGVE